MGQPEAYVEKYLVNQCRKLNILCYKFLSGTDGVPDRILIANDKTWFVETKRSGGKPRPLQETIFEDMKDHGAKVFVASSREEIDQILSDILK